MKNFCAILLCLEWIAFCARAATFQFTAITRETNGIAVQWNGDAGKNYQIESSVSVTGPWQVRTTIAGNAGVIRWVDTEVSGQKQRFYRLSLAAAGVGGTPARDALFAGDTIPKGVILFGEQSGDIAVNAVFLASQLGAGGAQLVTTGTLSQQGQNWNYSSSPGDHLVARFATGTNVDFYITRMQGDFSVNATAFLRRPHTFDYRVVTPGVADLTFVSDVGVGTPSFRAAVNGTFVGSNVTYRVDLTLSGQYFYESAANTTVLNDYVMTGTVRAPGFDLVVDQRRRYELIVNFVNFGGATRVEEASSDQDWISNTLTVGTDAYKWVNANKQKSFKNGAPSSVDTYWQASGSVLKNGQPHGSYRAKTDLLTQLVKFVLIVPGDEIVVEAWRY